MRVSLVSFIALLCCQERRFDVAEATHPVREIVDSVVVQARMERKGDEAVMQVPGDGTLLGRVAPILVAVSSPYWAEGTVPQSIRNALGR